MLNGIIRVRQEYYEPFNFVQMNEYRWIELLV